MRYRSKKIRKIVAQLFSAGNKSKLFENTARLTIEHLEKRILLTTNAWAAAAGGDWDTVSNWSLGHVPTVSEDALISVPGNYTVTHNSNGTDSVHSLISNQALSISNGMLMIGTSIEVDNTLTLQGGVLEGGTLTVPSASTFLMPYGSYGTLASITINGNILTQTGTLSSVTVNGNIQATSGGNLSITNGLVLNGIMTVSFPVGFVGSQSLTGSGTVDLLNNGIIAATFNGTQSTLTIGSGITITAQNGALGGSGSSTMTSIVNDGVIEANFSGQSLTIASSLGNLTNIGTLKATGGGTLSVNAANWSSIGIIQSDVGSMFSLENTCTNTGATLSLTGGGVFGVMNGTLQGGTVQVPATTTFAVYNGGTLSGVTVNGNILVGGGTLNNTVVDGNFLVSNTNYGSGASITNGLVLNGTATLTVGSNQASYFLQFSGTQTLAGNGMIVLGSYDYLTVTSAATLTVGANVLIVGQNGTITGSATAGLINQGTIESNTSGGTLTISGNLGTLTNMGALKATGGGILSVGAVSWTNTGTVESDAGSMFNFENTCINTGATLLLTGGGVFDVYSGTIQGGSVQVPATATFAVYNGGTLSGVTVNGNVLVGGGTLNGATADGNVLVVSDPNYGSNATISSGLTLNGIMTLIGSTTSNSPRYLGWIGSQTLAGNGTITLGAGAGSGVMTIFSSGGGATATLTVAPGILISGGNGSLGGSGNTVLVNQGTIEANVSGGAITITGGLSSLANSGTLEATNGGTLNVNAANWSGLGNYEANPQSSMTFSGVFVASMPTLTLSGTGSFIFISAIFQGTTITAPAASSLQFINCNYTSVTIYGSVGDLSGSASQLTLNGNAGLGSLTVSNGLQLNGVATVIPGNSLQFSGSQSITGDGTLNLGTNNLAVTGGVSSALTIGPSVLVRCQGGTISSSGTIIVNGTLRCDANTQSTNLYANVIDNGSIQDVDASPNGNGLAFHGSVTVNGQGSLSDDLQSYIAFYGSILGNTVNSTSFTHAGAVYIYSSGTSGAPLQLEAMSQDRGATAAGFANNYAINSLLLQGGYFQLVNNAQNSSGLAAEALYTNSLYVPSGTTVNLNGFHLYARSALIQGTVIGGSVTVMAPGGGSLPFSQWVSGVISTPGQIDHWSFFGTVDRSLQITFGAGDGAGGAQVLPILQWLQLHLAGPTGATLEAWNSSSSYGSLTFTITLPATGTYTVSTQAGSQYPSLLGSYSLIVNDVTPVVEGSIIPNQPENGTISTPYSSNLWSFTAGAGTQVQFSLSSASASGLLYTLTGPNGFVGFSGATGSSPQITLPTGGIYTLGVQGSGSTTGAYSFDLLQSQQTTVNPQVPFSGSFAGSGQTQIFQVPLTTSGPATFTLTDTAAGDHNEIYLRFGAPPTLQSYDSAAAGAGGGQTIVVPSAASGNWYALVYSDYIAAPPTPFTFAVTSGLIVTGSNISATVSNAPTTLTLSGAGFSPGMTVSLVSASGASYTASTTSTNLPTQLTASFATGAVPPGTYSVHVSRSDGAVAAIPLGHIGNIFQVLANGQPHLTTNLELPDPMTLHIAQTLYIDYSNTGTAAMQAPLLILNATTALGNQGALLTLDPALQGEGLWSSVTPPGFSQSIEILGSGSSPGLLGPGESVRVPVYYAGWLRSQWYQGALTFSLQAVQPSDTTAANWPSLQSSLQPPGITTAAWNSIFANLQAQMGPTAGGYVQLLDNQEAYLNQLGENVRSVPSLWGLAVQEADNSLTPLAPDLNSATDLSMSTPGRLSLAFTRKFAEPISGRDVMSTLGMGWSSPWQVYATVATPGGTITINEPGGGQRIFEPSSINPGAYLSQPGDTGIVTIDGTGSFLLTEANGSETEFATAGGLQIPELPVYHLNYVQDANGNRVSAAYDQFGKLLMGLSTSSGQSLAFGYNTVGLVSTVTDSTGRSVAYAYDSSNTYLLSVTSYTGQIVSYTYNTNGASSAQNALTSIAFPGGTHEYFSYDSLGRLSGTSGDGNSSPDTFTYSIGQVDVTNGTGDTSALYYNENGQVVKSVDALGNPTYYTYDANYNLSAVTNSGGQSEFYGYNAAHEVIATTDFLGNRTSFSYAGPDNQLSQMTDANGNATSYSYNAAGNLLGTTYANGTVSSATYNPEGEATSFINANGQPIHYTYNSAGQILTESFSDGSQYSYAYDAHGNLTTATDATGTTTFSYNATTQLLTEVAYPNGLWLKFSYDAAGQRTQMVDQTGFTTNYVYDSAGRLSELTDIGGNMIVTYVYDADGRLSKKTNGNGTYTTYAYNPDGNVLHLINYAPAGTINSRFDYGYNALGEENSEATIDGTWSYGYNADDELITAVFTPNASNPDGLTAQNLAYNYDAMGNRTSTIINGAMTVYTVNNMNEYTSVGGVGYQYDADGNLRSNGVASFNYNSLNQLINLTVPGSAFSYSYSALGQQVSSSTNGAQVQLLIDPLGLGNCVAQFGGSGQLIAENRFGLGLVSQTTGDAAIYFDFDLLGSTTGVSVASGAEVSKYSYFPFGANFGIPPASPFVFAFGGSMGQKSGPAGLYQLGARFLDAASGRFLTQDPAGLELPNLYAYASNDPINLVDPSGLSPLPAPVFSQYGPGSVSHTIGIPLVDFVQVGVVVGPHGYGYTVSSGFNLGLPVTTLVYPDGATSGLSRHVDLGPVAIPFNGDGYTGNTGYGPAGLGGNVSYTTEPQSFLNSPVVWLGLGLWGLNRLLVPKFPGLITTLINTITAYVQDPNALYGPAGYGTSNFIAGTNQTYAYQLDFENAATATAPVQQVVITDQLSTNLNWNSFQLTGISWGSFNLAIPAGSQSFSTVVPMTYNGETFDIEVSLGIRISTGQVYATFLSIDPTTGLPPSNALVGFLPPEDGTGRGQGYLTYTIAPKANLPTATQITNIAYVSFDAQTPIATDEVNDEDLTQGIDPAKQALVTIDSGSPTSSVSVPPQTTGSTSFAVNWSGQDDAGGSGIASYSVYVSTNGGAYTAWQINTSSTSAVFTGQPGNVYCFYSVATDNVGNVQSMPVYAQTLAAVGQTLYLKQDSGGAAIDIWSNASGTGADIVSAPVNSTTAIQVIGTIGNDSLTVDLSGGTSEFAGGISYSPNLGGRNSLNAIGTTNGNDSVLFATDQLTIDSIQISYTPPTTAIFALGLGTDTINVSSGTLTFAAGAAAGITTDRFYSLFIGNGAELTFATAPTSEQRSLLVTQGLTITGGVNAWSGSLDLGGNDLDITGGSLAIITNQLASGYANGTWNGTGIESLFAAMSITHLTTLGVLQNNQSGSALYGSGAPLGQFDGTYPGEADVLVKYTYYGDTNLDGKVDGTDYTRIDNGYLSKLTGWANGDFNYDGAVNGSDYTLIDNAFNAQGAKLAASIASPQALATAQTSASKISEPRQPAKASLEGGKSVRSDASGTRSRSPSFAPKIFSTGMSIAFANNFEDSVELLMQKKDVLDALTSGR